MPAPEVEPVGGHEGRRVEQDVPAVHVRLLDPLERVLDAGEVRLRGIGEQVVVIARRLSQVPGEQALVDAEIGRDAGHVGGHGTAGARELADAVDRVMVVEGRQEAVAGPEPIRLADQAQRAGRVGREDRDVLVRRGVEERQHLRACTPQRRRAPRRSLG
jgi:hypothetical protein